CARAEVPIMAAPADAATKCRRDNLFLDIKTPLNRMYDCPPGFGRAANYPRTLRGPTGASYMMRRLPILSKHIPIITSCHDIYRIRLDHAWRGGKRSAHVGPVGVGRLAALDDILLRSQCVLPVV